MKWPCYAWYIQGKDWGRAGYARTATDALDAVERATRGDRHECIAIQRQWQDKHEPALIRYPQL